MKLRLMILLLTYFSANIVAANEPEADLACKIPNGVYTVKFNNDNMLSLEINNGDILSFSGFYQERSILLIFGEDKGHTINFNLVASNCINNKIIIVWDSAEESPSYLSKNSGILYGRYSQDTIFLDDISTESTNLSVFSGMTDSIKQSIAMEFVEKETVRSEPKTNHSCDFLSGYKFTLNNSSYLVELDGYDLSNRDFVSVYEYSYRDIFEVEFDIKIEIDDFIYACSDNELFLVVIPKRHKNKVVVTSKKPENAKKSTTRHSLLFGGRLDETHSSINSTISRKSTFQDFTFIRGEFEKVE